MVWISDPLDENPNPPIRQVASGSLGRRVTLFSNYYKVVPFDVTKNVTLHHFDVKILDAKKSDGSDELEKITPYEAVAATAGPQKSNAEKKKKRRMGRPKGPKPGKEPPSQAGIDLGDMSSALDNVATPHMNSSYKRHISKALGRKIFSGFIKEHPEIFEATNDGKGLLMTFDGICNAYCATSGTAIPQILKGPIRFKLKFYDETLNREKEYHIVWKLVGKSLLKELLQHLPKCQPLTHQCQDIFHMLQVMLNYEHARKYATSSLNNFFSHKEERFGQNFQIGHGKEGVIGFHSSLRPCGWKDASCLMLNIDVAHRPFLECKSLLKYLRSQPSAQEYFKNEELGPEAIGLILDKIVKEQIKISTKHGGYTRQYKVVGVSDKTSMTCTFDVTKDGEVETITVAEYFERTYGTTLKYPRMNCLLVGNKKSHMPIEMCDIVANQRVRGRLGQDESREFIKRSAQPPQQRKKQISEIFDKSCEDKVQVLASLGLEVDHNMVKFEGRVIEPPVVELGKKLQPKIERGEWKINLYRDAFKQPAKLDHWAIINFSTAKDADEIINEFKKMMMDKARNFGMDPKCPRFVKSEPLPCNVGDLLEKINKDCKGLRLLVFVIDDGDKRTYPTVKAKNRLNFVTQCAHYSTLVKLDGTIMLNLLLKINVKLGGVSHVALPRQPDHERVGGNKVMVMGADVNHPDPGDKLSPSIVAVVASVDVHACKYVREVRHQNREHKGRDIITDMKEITKNLLEQFWRQNKILPEKIMMFRDGVSETQFSQVLASELRAMREACTSISTDYKPSMTFLCVQKKHHTRLFLEKGGNVEAGTVADTTITSPWLMDFYLNSHTGLRGSTNRPAHYTVLWDDSDMSFDQIQRQSFSQCHNYARCFRSTSIPTAVYYAHHAAFKAKVLLDEAILTDGHKWLAAAEKSGKDSYPDEELDKVVRVDISMETSRRMDYV
ncbi:protein argonaute-4 isoform X2 [Hyalella azteca]|uniref:Protein argonaute-4 isoform X2 n=1 Tax=Hyalella azteca TaxID=294128 RepID=A0A8B7P6T5_HYAAZ|nr:protein argonaute-4 isoform X2 [Hyalella azteca]